jgi:hypothetical protein
VKGASIGARDLFVVNLRKPHAIGRLAYDGGVGTYRDDLEAAQARAGALDREVAELREKNAELEKRARTASKTTTATPRPRIVQQLEPMPDPPTTNRPEWPWWRKAGLVGFILSITLCAIAITQTHDDAIDLWGYILVSGAVLGGFFGWLALGAPAEA